MFVVDTNVLLYAADVDAPAHARCKQLVEEWRQGAAPWGVTWPIVYEFLRVATHPRVFRVVWPTAAAWQFVGALISSPSVRVLSAAQDHAQILAEELTRTPALMGNVLHDVHTVTLMREHGVKVIYTRDTDFHRFAGIEVRDPLVTS
jgi:hypothetical protein